MIRFNAHFDGKHVCPDEPVTLPKNVPLRVTVDEVPASQASIPSRNPAELFEELEAECGLIDAPSDWAAQHDHYLYGATQRADGTNE